MSNFRHRVLIADFIYLGVKQTAHPRPVRQRKFAYAGLRIDKKNSMK